MHDTPENPSPAPDPVPLAAAPPPTAVAVPDRAPGPGRRLVALLSWPLRRPLQALSLLLSLAVLAGALGLGGVALWTGHHLKEARRELTQGHNIRAIDHLHACRLFRPDQREVLILSARVARRSGAWGEAETLLDRYGQLHGDDDSHVLERLLLAATRGEVESVRPQLSARIDAGGPEAALARDALAAGLLYRFRLEDADRLLAEWLQAEPDSTLALLARGKLLDMREQSSEAAMSYRRVLELDPLYDEARLRLAKILVELSQGEESLTHLEYLRSRLPGHAETLLLLAQALELQRRSEEAVAVLEDGLRRHPDHPGLLAERGRIARRDGDNPQAEQLLRRAVKLDPANFTARYQLHLALAQAGKTEEAAREQQAIQRMEEDLRRINEIVQGRLQANPHDPAIHYEVAMIALRAGRPHEAMRWLQSALAADPDYGPAHRGLAAYYHDTGSPILAARHRALAQRSAARP